jgi:hypothetical protein
MVANFPYQIVAFLKDSPSIDEPVYNGSNGWYAQLALKRRFAIVDMNEDELIAKTQRYCSEIRSFSIQIKSYVKPSRIPVGTLEVCQTDELVDFHNGFIHFMDDKIISKYPDREGANYLPHITADYDSVEVIDRAQYQNQDFKIKSVCILKDIGTEDSAVIRKIELQP